jgi:hypothetical protein
MDLVDREREVWVRGERLAERDFRFKGSRFARLAVISAKCCSLGELSTRYRSSHRVAAFSYFGDPRSV